MGPSSRRCDPGPCGSCSYHAGQTGGGYSCYSSSAPPQHSTRCHQCHLHTHTHSIVHTVISVTYTHTYTNTHTHSIVHTAINVYSRLQLLPEEHKIFSLYLSI